MKIIFFGTPSFAVHILDRLVKEGFHIAAVVTQPDRPKGRFLQLQPLPLKQWLLNHQPTIPCFQPDKVSTPDMEEILRSFDPDLFITVGYGEILKDFILAIPKIECINIHTSLLPKYRGAAPIQRAILAGETTLGVSIMRMVKKMDAGDVFAQRSAVFDENAYFEDIEKKLMQIAADLLIEILPDIYQKKIFPSPQDESAVTFAPKITPEDLVIDWHCPAKHILNQIRAFSPQPGAMCKVEMKNEEKKLKIYTAKYFAENSTPKTILSFGKNVFGISCGEGAVLLQNVKLEGKSITTFDALLRGYPQMKIL